MSGAWVADTQLDGFEQRSLELPDEPRYPGEPEELTATLVRRCAPIHGRALLYVHGWSDYFFQAHLAHWADAQGYDLYALDLRRYGRSLRQGQLAGFITDLNEYFVELDAAADVIAGEGADRLVVMGHSTGGLTASLWASEHPERLSALVLNSPWLDVQQSPMLRSALSMLLSAVRTPTTALPFAGQDIYRRSISSSLDGAWDFSLNLKSDPAFLVRAGWLNAVLTGQARVAAGLAIEVPVLMLVSERSDFRRQWSDDVRRADVVLDVEKLAERASGLGRHVTLIRVADGMHDLALSDQPARDVYFDEVARWLRTYA